MTYTEWIRAKRDKAPLFSAGKYESYTDYLNAKAIRDGDDSFMNDYKQLLSNKFYNKVQLFISKDSNDIDLAIGYRDQLIKRAKERIRLRETLKGYNEEYIYVYGKKKINSINKNLIDIKNKIHNQLNQLDKIIESKQQSTVKMTETVVVSSPQQKISDNTSQKVLSNINVNYIITTILIIILLSIIIVFRKKLLSWIKLLFIKFVTIIKYIAKKIKCYLKNTKVFTFVCYFLACLMYGIINAIVKAMGYSFGGILSAIVLLICLVFARNISDNYKNK